jgi:Zn-dependent protease with chaperone function
MTTMSLCRLIGVFLFIPAIGLGQYQDLNKNFMPAATIDTIPSNILRTLKWRRDRAVATLADRDRRVVSQAKEIYKDVFNIEVKLFNSDKFLSGGELTDYLNAIVNRLQRSSSLTDTVLVFACGEGVANAFSSADGIIACNTELISRIENSEQLAFVLSHELAHYYLHHTRNAVMAYARLNYDKNVREDIKNIKRTGYWQYSKTKTLVENLSLSLNKHNRDHEFQSDSLGLVIYQNAGYNPAEAIRTMEILDSAEVTKKTGVIDFPKFFHFRDYPFKKEWLRFERGTMYHAGLKNDSDTAKTHPDCKRRIIALRKQLNNTTLRRSTPKESEDSFYFSRLSAFQQVESQFHQKKYGKSLFEALWLIERYPDNIYLHSMVGRNMYAIVKAMQSHTFGKVIDQPDDRFPENYSRFIAFIQNLRINEMTTIAQQYLAAREEKYFDDENFLFAFWEVSHVPGSVVNPGLVRDDYKEKFPRGKYLAIMK